MSSFFQCQFVNFSKWILVSYTIHIQGRNFVILCSPTHHFVYIIESSSQRSEQTPPSGFHSPLAVQWNLPSPAPSGPKFNGIVFTAALVVWIHLHAFTSLRTTRDIDIQTSKWNELAEVPNVCSHPSCHPTQLHSSFHSSKLQSSFHSSRLHPSWVHESSVTHVCADSWVSELVSDFEFPRPEKQFSTIYPCTSLWHLWFLWTFLWIFSCSLDSFLYIHS